MKNASFSALLSKYRTANKISNSKLVESFVEDYPPNDTPSIDVNATPEMVTFAKTFITRKMKCTDPEFNSKLADIAANNNEVEFKPTVKVSYSGEY